MNNKCSSNIFNISIILICSVLLASCGGESQDSEGTATLAGKNQFDQACANCHATNTLGLAPYTIDSLASRIETTMPPNNPGSCAGQCALEIAQFIAQNNPNFGQSPSTNSAAFGSISAPQATVAVAPSVINRLNNTQYNNTVRDLLNTNKTPANTFPHDNLGGAGQYDTIAGSHSISLTHVEQYLAASQELAEDAVNNGNVSCGFLQGNDCAQSIINSLAERAWRRPLTDAEKSQLLGIFTNTLNIGWTQEDALKQLVQAILLSPNFLFRPEFNSSNASDQPFWINAYELASRLSYFLWNTMPDEVLFEAAKNNSLLQESELRAQVKRMLQDPRAEDALVENFMVQWLKVDRASAPSASAFPNFSDSILQAMKTETRLLLKSIFSQNAPLSEIISADYTFLNNTLANHYGVTGISGSNFQRYNWGEEQRRGILGQGSFLTATSHPDTTSPVQRGAWILTNLVCQEPPPPPQGVNTEIILDPNLSTREQSELHRDAGSACFGCHSLMDPLGFGLENFDSAGQWRIMDGQHWVDASGTLPGGLEFNGPVELSQILSDAPRFTLCAIDHMMTYGVGRSLDAFHDVNNPDKSAGYAAVYDVFQKSAASGHRIQDIIEEIVLSPIFRMRSIAEVEE